MRTCAFLKEYTTSDKIGVRCELKGNKRITHELVCMICNYHVDRDDPNKVDIEQMRAQYEADEQALEEPEETEQVPE